MPEMVYRRKTDKHKRYFCSSGSRFENEYQEEIDSKSGKLSLKKIGKKNIYEIIQADREDTKIENILWRLANNDMSVLKQATLTYVDEKDFPKSLMEAQNIVVKARQEFDKFPMEVKKLFNNSCEQYVSELGTEDFFKKMSPYNNELKKKQEAERKAEFDKSVSETVAFNKAVNAAMSEGSNE